MNEYFVYALIDPRNKQVFYIGKGKGRRHLQHVKEIPELSKDYTSRKKGINENKVKRLQEIITSGHEIEYKIIASELSEESAYILEEILVERLGRVLLKNGNLLNLEPGGNWPYGKVLLEESEKTTLAHVSEKYPELLPVLDQYPHIATKSKLMPWWVAEIPKERALYQYQLNGEYMDVHNETYLTSGTGMRPNLILHCILNNRGYAYGSQWAKEYSERLHNLTLLPKEELEKMERFIRWDYRKEIEIETARNYQKRNRTVES
ncbi:GIY-YIG nuclease family protein [Rufibacter quisquiliarum]|uniref:GIY-YIG domain-containing protein n=1 Tax=Rufibacter quisquiliarum TaxID=1549639 RepID=A0A839GI79_9BACT|nr:GIY-YIG nuclease family protein [Rufibacter quisquiliarum]MBA9078330.1 hypothetical protein [Rufibacter quisquiliarum]